MKILAIILRLLFEDPGTTDDSWSCWVEDGTVEVCERELSPCHYEVTEAECTIVVKRVRLGTLECDVNDPLACLPEA